jgi:hypothetical protein
MPKLNKIAKLLAISCITFSGVATADSIALAKALESGSNAALQAFVATHSDSPYAGEVILLMAQGGPFKAPGVKGRPPLFGPPGKPVIGPPGQYFG